MSGASTRWALPTHDPWSTPFAETLLSKLDLRPGLTILDVASGHGIPAFYVAEQVGPSGRVVAVDLSAGQVARAHAIQGASLPWLDFVCADVRALPSRLGEQDRGEPFDRITGNLSVMFFRPDRFATIRSLLDRLKPGGQLCLTFPSYGTFQSIWDRVDRELLTRGHVVERERFQAYLAERPSADDATAWLTQLGCERICVEEHPLEVESGVGAAFLWHSLLRGGFLDDVYECFEDQKQAEALMQSVADDVATFRPIVALRCVMSGWTPQ
ncbi:MAG: class I SAM-dependent methyltransferase [Nitrospiraceae bacterium]